MTLLHPDHAALLGQILAGKVSPSRALLPHQVLTRRAGFLSYVGPRGSGSTFTGAHAVAQRIDAGKSVAIFGPRIDDVFQFQVAQISALMDGEQPYVRIREGRMRWPKRGGWVTIMALDDADLVARIRSEKFDAFWCDDIRTRSEPAEYVGRVRMALNHMRRTGAEMIWTGPESPPARR